MCNLKTRLSDFEHAVSSVTSSDFQDGKFESLLTKKRLFLIFLTHLQADCHSFLTEVSSCLQAAKCDLYGIHLNRLGNSKSANLDIKGIEITGFTDSTVYSDCFPVLLYMIHLALGENATNNDNWSLTDVFNETTSVLKGLCNKCNLELLSKREVEGDLTEENSICKRKVSTSDETLGNVNCDSFDEPNMSVLDSNLKDLPLMANVNEVLVYHYVLNLDISFQEKSIFGTEILFLKPASDKVAEREFQMCLDCTLIDIESVTELVLPDNFDLHFHQDKCCCCSEVSSLPNKPDSASLSSTSCCTSCQLLQQNHHHSESTTWSTIAEQKSLNSRTLPYAVYGWCLRVWNVPSSRKHWPKCVVIKYKTKPIGPSLAWCKDQDGK